MPRSARAARLRSKNLMRTQSSRRQASRTGSGDAAGRSPAGRGHLGPTASPFRADISGMAPPAAARETAGTTICLIVRYVRHHAGDDGVDRLLELAGEDRPLEVLENEQRWSTYEQKIALLEAAAIVLDDPDVALHIGETALEHSVGPGIRILLRRLGSPRVVLSNVSKAAAKFSTVTDMWAEHIDKDFAVIRYRLHDPARAHRADCQLNIGFMRTIGVLFGMPPLTSGAPGVSGARGAGVRVRRALDEGSPPAATPRHRARRPGRRARGAARAVAVDHRRPRVVRRHRRGARPHRDERGPVGRARRSTSSRSTTPSR